MPESTKHEDFNDVPMERVGKMVLVGRGAVEAYVREFVEQEQTDKDNSASELSTDSDK